MVEHPAVNRTVVGSSPTFGAIICWPLGQAVKTPPFHGGNTGSNPVGVIKKRHSQFCECLFVWYARHTKEHLECSLIPIGLTLVLLEGKSSFLAYLSTF